MTRRKVCSSFVLLCLISLSGCAVRTIHPGAANTFDSDAYDSLLVQDNVIQSTKADLTNGVFPANIVQNVKLALNILIEAYNAEDIAYKAYHAAAIAGQPTATLQADLQTKQVAANNAVSSLASAKVTK
jgi:hypothetical protein